MDIDTWRKVSYILLGLSVAFLMISTIGLDLITDGGGSDLDYDFTLESEHAVVTVNGDGSVDIDYNFSFCNWGEIDGVDVGLPNVAYNASTAWAEVVVGGVAYPPREVRKSPYVSVGLAVEFSDEVMSLVDPLGTPFEVNFHVNNPNMVYRADAAGRNASVMFRPTWFRPSFQRGPTQELVVQLVLPEGHADLNETSGNWLSLEAGEGGRLVATWTWTSADPLRFDDGDYDAWVSFPARYVDTLYEEEPRVERESESLFEVLCLAPWPILMLYMGMLTFVSAYIIYTWQGKNDYFDPELTVASAGPRRDLTAVEAAVVLELPMNRIAAMVLFGLERKGLVKVDRTYRPLKVMRQGSKGEHAYETRFLGAVRPDGTMDKKLLTRTLTSLVEETEDKLRGFSLKGTRTYYRAVCERAWAMVEEAGTAEAFADVVERKNEWLLIDPKYERRMGAFHSTIYASAVAGGTTGGRVVDIQAMARSYVDDIKGASRNLVHDIKGIGADVTKVTNPSASGGGGGGGCACACACAGGGR